MSSQKTLALRYSVAGNDWWLFNCNSNYERVFEAQICVLDHNESLSEEFPWLFIQINLQENFFTTRKSMSFEMYWIKLDNFLLGGENKSHFCIFPANFLESHSFLFTKLNFWSDDNLANCYAKRRLLYFLPSFVQTRFAWICFCLLQNCF